jgi:hypothetical protein
MNGHKSLQSGRKGSSSALNTLSPTGISDFFSGIVSFDNMAECLLCKSCSGFLAYTHLLAETTAAGGDYLTQSIIDGIDQVL